MKKLYIKALAVVGLICTLAVFAGCNRDDFGDPIAVPQHPAFIFKAGANTMTVFDLGAEKVVGYRQVARDVYSIDDFDVSKDGCLYIPVPELTNPIEGGEWVLVVDMEAEHPVTDSITTPLFPDLIFPLNAGTKALVSHCGVPWATPTLYPPS